VSSIEDAESKATKMQDRVLKFIQSSDAEEAAGKGIKTRYGEASLKQVELAYVKVGFESEHLYETYALMNEMRSNISDMSLTSEQLERWDYIKNNTAVIQAYKTLVEGL